ncbi:hypothetical protein JCM10213v2_007493 [Rhodosporidiobolus nylandii]
MVMVAAINVLDGLHSVFAINSVYHWAVRNYMNPATLAYSPWSFTAEPVMTGLTATIVHVFYAHRVMLVSEGARLGRLLALGIVVLSLVQFGFGAAVTGKIVAFDRESFNGKLQKPKLLAADPGPGGQHEYAPMLPSERSKSLQVE